MAVWKCYLYAVLFFVSTGLITFGTLVCQAPEGKSVHSLMCFMVVWAQCLCVFVCLLPCPLQTLSKGIHQQHLHRYPRGSAPLLWELRNPVYVVVMACSTGINKVVCYANRVNVVNVVMKY